MYFRLVTAGHRIRGNRTPKVRSGTYLVPYLASVDQVRFLQRGIIFVVARHVCPYGPYTHCVYLIRIQHCVLYLCCADARVSFWSVLSSSVRVATAIGSIRRSGFPRSHRSGLSTDSVHYIRELCKRRCFAVTGAVRRCGFVLWFCLLRFDPL